MTDSGTFKEEDLVWNEKHGAGRVALSDGDGVLVEFTGGNEELFEANGKKNIPLIKLDEDGYVLRMQREPDAMCALAKDAPAELIKTFIVDFGAALSAAALERHISGTAVPADEWKEWWKQTQVVLREDPRFAIEKDTVHYLGDMVQIAHDLLVDFKNARNIKEKQKICREILRLEEKGVPVEEAKEAAITFFTGTAASTTHNVGARLEALLFLEGLDPVQFEMTKKDIYGRIARMGVHEAADALVIIADNAIRVRILNICKEILADKFIDISMSIIKRYKKQQRDWVLDTLLLDEDPKYIKALLEITLSDIPTNQQPFVWFGLRMMESPQRFIKLDYSPDDIIRRWFKLLLDAHITSAFSSNPKEGPSVSREEDEIKKFLLKKKAVLKMLRQHTDNVVLMFGQLYYNNNAMSDEDKAEMLRLLREQYPTLDFDSAVASADVVRDEVTLTREAFDRYEKEFEDLIERQLPDISRAIGTAREMGDISENAEYHAAKEKQGMLMSRKRYLERLLDVAQVLDE